jgi:hypothetical protein
MVKIYANSSLNLFLVHFLLALLNLNFLNLSAQNCIEYLQYQLAQVLNNWDFKAPLENTLIHLRGTGAV